MRRYGFPAFKIALAALVLYALWRHLASLYREWASQGDAIRALAIDGKWIVASAASCLIGQLFFACFWQRLLAILWDESSSATQRNEHPSTGAVIRSYAIGTVGKYVPGKAWVVLLRTGFLNPGPSNRFTVALSILYETLFMMATGGLAATLCLLPVEGPGAKFTFLGLAVFAAILSGLHPAVFGRLVRIISLPLCAAYAPSVIRKWFRTSLRAGWMSLAGWAFLGASAWSAAEGIGLSAASPEGFFLFSGGSALATVLGFLVFLMPAGLGVRELVLIEILTPRWGAAHAVILALWIRTIWTAVEFFMAGGAWLDAARIRRRERPKSIPPHQ